MHTGLVNSLAGGQMKSGFSQSPSLEGTAGVARKRGGAGEAEGGLCY